MAAGETILLDDGELETQAASRGVDLSERIAVLAVGSNAGPARLVDKCGLNTVIPAALVRLTGTAIVFSAHISRYGSIPTTRLERPASTARLHVLFLDGQQVEQIDDTEGSYDRVEIDRGIVDLGVPVYEYASWRGFLISDSDAIRAAEIPGRSDLSAMTQIEALDYVARTTMLAPNGQKLSDGVARGVIDADQVNELLAAGALRA